MNMECFNFCHPCFNPSVVSSAVCAEGYDVANLVSKDASKKHKGFMVYRTITPPVDVTFRLMCKINISHIILWSQVGNQKSSGFYISTNANIKPGTFQRQTAEGFVNVGSGFLQKETGVIFYHSHKPKVTNADNFLHRQLSVKFNALSAVTSVQIRIVKTDQSSIPALLKVEIWGLPSISCPKEIRMKVIDLWSQRNKMEVEKRIEKKTAENVLRTTAKALVGREFEIPDEFVDSITCQIMVLPFILPSGKIIDQSTIEKHEAHEANWGRRPSDPFTGKLYTETSKPVLAAALKARIDKFLVEHADKQEVKNTPRTVGRNPLKQKERIETATNNNLAKTFAFPSESTDSQHGSVYSLVEDVSNLKPRTSGFAKREVSPSNTKTDKNKRLRINDSSLRTEVTCEFEKTRSQRYFDSEDSHEERINQSLNAALKSALSRLPSFTNFNRTEERAEIKCHSCSGKAVLYELPCQHMLCRSCLTHKTQEGCLSCTECRANFNLCDPKRYHS